MTYVNEFFIGQRVMCDRQICICVEPPYKDARPNDLTTQWVKFPNDMYQWRHVDNVKPLPNGQL